MALDLHDVGFSGPAMPEPFVRYKLEPLLAKKKLLTRESKAEKKELQQRWEVYYRKLRILGGEGLDQRVLRHVIEPLVERLGFQTLEASERVATREGQEPGGYLLQSASGPHLRAWAVPIGTDLDAPNRRGRAYRFSPALIAQRVLLAKGERIGLLTDGEELRIVLSDPFGRDSHLSIKLDRSSGWRGSRQVPDSYRLLLALCAPQGIEAIPELLDEARLAQTGVTKQLREQARRAVERFIQGVIDDPTNRAAREDWSDLDAVARTLWDEGLIFVYRLLFILKLETALDPARSFSFATVSTWRNSFSPSTALAPIVEAVRDQGAQTGGFLSASLRSLFRLFAEGLSSSDLEVSPLGGMLFGPEATPTLDSLVWSEHAVAGLLDALLWTSPGTPARGGNKKSDTVGRERVHYGTLDVEDLGRVYEALLELEPGVTREPMCRLRRAKLEVVVPLAQGMPFRSNTPGGDDQCDADDDASGKRKVVFVEEIAADRFFLRVGLGRKASGSYYTPHPFVRFLVEETLGPQVAQRSPHSDPDPNAILSLKVLDPAMGSGHFLVEACRYLGEALYEACRLCDELALDARRKAETTKKPETRASLSKRATALWKRVQDVPDPNDELVAYLPSRILDARDSGLSQQRALALCRRLVSVHCLYGVDKNPLAVELARVSLWLESYAEGWPLTFLDHRLLIADSLAGAFFEHLLTYPSNGEPIRSLYAKDISTELAATLGEALKRVRDLEASIGKDAADIELKKAGKASFDRALHAMKTLAAAWVGGVRLGEDGCSDPAYENMLRAAAAHTEPSCEKGSPSAQMIDAGLEALPFDLVFPEVFYPDAVADHRSGFDVVIGNPPWDSVRALTREFLAGFDLRILNAPTKRERSQLEEALLNQDEIRTRFSSYVSEPERNVRVFDRIFVNQAAKVDGKIVRGNHELGKLFTERFVQLARPGGYVGLLAPASLHVAAGTAGIRHLLLRECNPIELFSFSNRLRLFDIEAKVKFSVIVAQAKCPPKGPLRCRFKLSSFDDLATQHPGELTYSSEFIAATGGPYATLIELDGDRTRRCIERCTTRSRTFGDICRDWKIKFSRELDPTLDASILCSAADVIGGAVDARDPDRLADLQRAGYLVVGGEDAIHLYTDHWTDPPIHLARGESVASSVAQASRYFRVFYRRIANVVDLRSMKAAMVPPGWVASSPFADRTPMSAATSQQLLLLAVLNSFTFDWALRLRLTNTLNLFIVESLPVPNLHDAERLLAHQALRLSCNHAAYAPLWDEQLADEWREPGPRSTWPVLDGDDARWLVRAALDAVVADAYGLDRGQYAHVLSSFSHSSYRQAPELCLAAFDELKKHGLKAFLERNDPYWDIPLVTTLPKPTLDLPGGDPSSGSFQLTTPSRERARRGTKV